jgi:hypothetical protein
MSERDQPKERIVAALRRWIHLRAPTRARVDARDLDQLRADWGACYLELKALPPGSERDRVAKRCAELAKSFEHSFRRTPGFERDKEISSQGLAEHALILALIVFIAIVTLIFLGSQPTPP